MASDTIKIRAKEKDGVVTVKALVAHPMETGTRRDGNGNIVPAHYIQEVRCEYQGRLMMLAHWGPAISTNPYLSFRFNGGSKGERIKLSWVDNTGDSDSLEAEIR